jgi:hypothetical protein
MAERIVQILKNKEQLMKMGRAAREMTKRFGLDVITRKWEKLIEALLTETKDALQTYIKQEFWRPVQDGDRFIRQVAREYESAVLRMIPLAANRVSAGTGVSWTGDAAAVVSDIESEVMKRTVSWRITKPLRLVRKWMLSLETNGWRITIRKTFAFLLRIFHRTR